MAYVNHDEELDRAPVVRISRSRAWLVPAVVVAVVLSAAVYVGRSGNSSPSPSPVATQPLIALNGPETAPPPTLAQAPAPARAQPPTPEAPLPSPISSFAERVGGLRYVDGLPTSYNGQPVIRVEDALKRPVGQSLLVAGWYSSQVCEPDSMYCLEATLSDNPAGSPAEASMMVTGTQFWSGDTGPRILEGTMSRECSTPNDPACALRLDVTDTVWQGDPLTDADPLTTVSLLKAFSGGMFTGIEFKSFEESTSCPLQWPSQTYRATSPAVSRADLGSLPVELVLIFPDTVDRIDAQGPIEQAAQNISSSDVALRCVGIAEPVGPDSWVARDNVMILLGDDSTSVAQQVRAALSGAS